MTEELHLELSKLTGKRKKDRARLAEIVSGLCDKSGVSYEVEEGYLGQTRCVCVKIVDPNTGLAVDVEFDGDSPQRRPDIYVLSWRFGFAAARNDLIISPVFVNPEAINPYHHRKATDVVRSNVELINVLEARLKCIHDGTATQAAGIKKTNPLTNSTTAS